MNGTNFTNAYSQLYNAYNPQIQPMNQTNVLDYLKGLGESLWSKPTTPPPTVSPQIMQQQQLKEYANIPFKQPTNQMIKPNQSPVGSVNANPNGVKPNGVNPNGGGNMLGNTMSVLGIVSGLADMYTGWKAYQENKKTMRLQREAMRYNLDRTRSENRRLDRQRADTTKSWNSGGVM